MKKALSVLPLLFLLCSSIAAEVKWYDSIEEAQKKASEEKKSVILVISGGPEDLSSTWFEDHILGDKKFAEVANDYVLVKLSIPITDKMLDEEITKFRKMFTNYAVYQLPAVIFFDEKGRSYASIVPSIQTVENFILTLDNVKIVKTLRDAMFEAARLSPQGPNKAHYLHLGLSIVSQSILLSVIHYKEEIDQILALDKDNAMNLRDGYLSIIDISVIRNLISDEKPKEVIEKAKEFLQKYADNPSSAQIVMYYQAVAARMLGDIPMAIECLRTALQLAPNSAQANMISTVLGYLMAQQEDKHGGLESDIPEDKLGEEPLGEEK